MYKKRFLLGVVGIGMALAIAACGGGGGSDQNAGNVLHSPKLKIGLYGTSSIAGKAKTTAMLKSLSPISEAVADGQGDAAAQALQDALTAAGVSAQVQVGVMDSATLHDFVQTNYNGQLPTDTQQAAAPDPDTWVIENFSPPDLRSLATLSVDDQVAAIAQFRQDLTIFIRWQHIAGKWPVVVLIDPSNDPAVDAVVNTVNQQIVSAMYDAVATIWSMTTVIQATPNWQAGMSGADGNTPNDDLKAVKTQELVRRTVELQTLLDKPAAAPAEPASAASS